MADILREMNAKLKRILPVDMFCCATMLNLSFQRGMLEVWNGGMPDGYLSATTARAAAGVAPSAAGHPRIRRFRRALRGFPMEDGDRVLLFSDGVLRRAIPGRDVRRTASAPGLRPACRRFAAVRRHPATLSRFRGEAQDDLSMLEIALVPDASLQRPPLAFSDAGERPAGLVEQFRVRAPTLRHSIPCLPAPAAHGSA
jgi:hypothetical protein